MEILIWTSRLIQNWRKSNIFSLLKSLAWRYSLWVAMKKFQKAMMKNRYYDDNSNMNNFISATVTFTESDLEKEHLQSFLFHCNLKTSPDFMEHLQHGPRASFNLHNTFSNTEVLSPIGTPMASLSNLPGALS
jgi:hypothetical protein